MSAPSPTPPGGAPSPTASTGTGTGGGAEAEADAGDWRKSVPQSYRSEEVRGVAKVLASLEPGATSASKLMLAMRFEDSIFQGASSLADYRKRLTKRLKKVQKSYKPPTPKGSATGAGTGGGAGAGGADDEEEARRKEEAETERELREKYGEELKFIVRHADEAVETMREKHGEKRAVHLRQHTDNAEQWAVELDIDTGVPTDRTKRDPRESGYLDRLRGHLEQRVDNIRSHVVKLTRPDLFLEETLVKVEDDMDDGTAEELARTALRVLERHDESSPLGNATSGADAVEAMRKLLERTAAPVAPPRRGSSEADVRESNLARLDKVRSAGQALIAYLTLDAPSKAAVKGFLRRVHNVAVDELEELNGALLLAEQNQRGGSGGGGKDSSNADGGEVKKEEEGGEKKATTTPTVRLEDAWNNVMEYDDPHGQKAGAAPDAEPPAMEGEDGGGDNNSNSQQQHPRKRARTDSSLSAGGGGGSGGGSGRTTATVTRSRVLLTPGRKAPTNLIVALRGKRAELFQPSTTAAGSAMGGAGTMTTRLRIEFGKAFEMIVHFVPLLVTLRALPADDGAAEATGEGDEARAGESAGGGGGGPSDFRRTIVDGGLPTWIPSTYGLDRGRRGGSGSGGGGIGGATAAPSQPAAPLTVLGVPGDASTIGPVIAKRLDYASACATRVLRRCFAEVAVGRGGGGTATGTATGGTGGGGGGAVSDFEVEISEATALLRFVQMARSTYTPGWQEDEPR